jgi:ribose transport system substrate-binding protein
MKVKSAHYRRSRFAGAFVAISLLAIASATAASGAPTTSATHAKKLTGLAYAEQQLAEFSKPVNHYTAPGPALKNVKKKLNGTTVWYIPIFLQAPAFTADAAALVKPLALAGVTVHVCDAGANPSQGAACINQAVAAHASGIVTDAINYSFAPQAYAAAIQAHIPIVATQNDDSQGFPKTSDLKTVSNGLPQTAALGADWIIANSKGKANVLYAADNSNDGTIEANSVKNEFSKYCPGCTLTVDTFSDPTVDDLTSSVPAALTSNPNINYVYAAYDAPSGALALQGANTVASGRFKFVAFTGQPPGMERVAAGQQSVDPANDCADAMWNSADALFRIVTGAKPVHYTTTVRVFTKANLPSDPSSAAAYANGSWFGNNSYQAIYRKLWGL